ncbi:MAG: GNAT family N-acetyltransferase [Gammaproteobacteria bacterium]|nr:GNAT family N-acetyltransferase [Gammaproteobacteria bacterium]
MRLIVFRDFCPELERYWGGIESNSQYHVFQSYQWLKFWQQTIGNSMLAIRPWIAVVLNADNQPKLIFPLGVRSSFGSRVLEFLGGAQSDYQGPLIHDEWLVDIPKIRFAWTLVCKYLPRHDVRHFIKLPKLWCSIDNPMLEIWGVRFQDYSYSAILPASVGEFQAKQRKKFRADSSRQRKRLSEQGDVKFEVLDAGQCGSWDKSIDIMIEQKRQRCRSMGVPDLFADDAVQEFYRELSKMGNSTGLVHFSVLRSSEEIAATHWGAIFRDRFYYLMPTITNGKLGVYSPGRLLLENLVEWCINNNIKVFDFTIGGEEYKRDWCNSEMPLFEHLRVVTPLGLHYAGYIRLRRRVRRNRRMWGAVKFLYSWLRYGKENRG